MGKPGIPHKMMSARPYIGRALKLLGRQKGLTTIAMLISLFVTLFPFIVSIAFSAIFQILGQFAAPRPAGVPAPSVNGIWAMTASLFGKTDLTWANSHGLGWLATPLTLKTVLIIWACGLVFAQLLSFTRSWVVAQLESRILKGLQQDIYDHLQSLSLDFFTGGQTGALMQRVLSEAGGVQRLLTQVLLYPLVDVIVLIVVLGYLLALSWQMTLVSFILAPLVLLMFRYTSKKMQQAARGMAMSGRELGAELEETISGIADIHNARRNADQQACYPGGPVRRFVLAVDGRKNSWEQTVTRHREPDARLPVLEDEQRRQHSGERADDDYGLPYTARTQCFQSVCHRCFRGGIAGR